MFQKVPSVEISAVRAIPTGNRSMPITEVLDGLRPGADHRWVVADLGGGTPLQDACHLSSVVSVAATGKRKVSLSSAGFRKLVAHATGSATMQITRPTSTTDDAL